MWLAAMRILVLCSLLISAWGCAAISRALADDVTAHSLQQSFRKSVAPFLTTYCRNCHGTEVQEAKLDLSEFTTAESVAEAHQVWEILRDRVAADEMPPRDAEPRPTEQQRQAFLKWIQTARDFQARQNDGDPGLVLARRLSNAEYNYTIRDLTGIDIRPTATFPVDPANEAGFDNTGESLTMSPALLNKYLQAARQVAEHLVLLPEGFAFAEHPVMTDTDRDRYCVKRIVEFYEQQPIDLAAYFFAAWKCQQVPKQQQDAATLAKLAEAQGISAKYLQTVWDLLMQPEAVGPIQQVQTSWRKLAEADESTALSGCEALRDHVLQLRAKLVPEIISPEVEGVHKGAQPLVLWRNRQYAANRRTYDPAVLQVQTSDNDADGGKANGDKATDAAAAKPVVDPDLTVPSDPELRQQHERAFAKFCDVFPDAFLIAERGRDYVKESAKQNGEKGRLLSAGFHSMMGYFRDDGPLYDLILNERQQQQLDRLWQELDFVTAAPMRQYVGFLWFERTDSRFMRDPQFDFARAEDKAAQSSAMIEKLAAVYLEKAVNNGGQQLALDAIAQYFRDIDTQIRWVEQARVAAEPSHLQAALEFADRAFRRPLTSEERDSLSAFYHSLKNDDGLSHEEAIQDVLVSVLMSPHFCYRADVADAAVGSDDLRPLTDHELASRLSYFLWSSMPDAELRAVAKSQTLRQPEVLLAQTRRMLQDDRVHGLATEFAGHWLDFRQFETHNSVDRQRFPEFDDALRQAMFEEPVRFFTDVVQQNRSVLDFLGGRHTFVNSSLAKHYGVANVAATDGWVRVENADAYGRGGVLPMAVFLTKNAPGLRTSPVKRGYWVVRQLLGERIPPPPPNVPELPNDEAELGDQTLREALARHREHASCAGCHERIDSVGLVFEGYGPVGEARTLDLAGRPVDTSAQLPGGHQAQGLEDLRVWLAENRQQDFVENLCRKLLSYGLGRSLILSDDLLVQRMQQRLLSNDHRFGSLIETIVSSPQFLNKR